MAGGQATFRLTEDVAQDGIPVLHARLCVQGPVAHVRDEADPGGAVERLRLLVLHVAPGGEWDAPATDDVLALVERLDRLRAKFARADPAVPQARRKRNLVHLARSVRAERRGDRVFFTPAPERPVAPRLREEEADDVLAAADGGGRVWERLPGVRWEAARPVRTSGETPYNPIPGHYEAPPLSLREYDNAVCLPRQAVVTDRWVPPEAYRNPFRHRASNVVLTDCTPLFVERPAQPTRDLAGRWFLLDTYVPGHFGHALTEQVTRLWGWQAAKVRDPSVRALLFTPPGGEIAQWTWDLLAAGGVAREDVEVAREPVAVERLLGCTPAYTIADYAHPVVAETWRGLGDALARRSSAPRGPERIFVSRGGSQRVCRNGDEVEALFRSHGFEVVRPERHSLADQVALFRGADVVAGYAGSGMFQVALSDRPQHVIAIATETYPAHNETAMTALLGHSLDVVVCQPDVPREDTDTFSERAFQSDYVVDWAAEGRWLRDVLDEL